MGRLAENDPRLAWPLYTLRQAAGYLGLPASTLQRWAKPRGGAPLVTTVSRPGFRERVPFIGFAEAFVIKAALNAGVPRHRIRPNIEGLRQEFSDVEHALAHQCVYTDGAELLFRQIGEDPESDLTVARTRQKQLRAAVESELKRIQYGGDGYAARLELTRFKTPVVVDPDVAAGAPILVHGGARVEDLVARARAGESASHLAQDYGAPLEEVQEIVGSA